MPVSSVNWMAIPDSTLALTLSAQMVRVPSAAPGGAEGVGTAIAVGVGAGLGESGGREDCVGGGDVGALGTVAVGSSAVALGNGGAVGVETGVGDGGGTGAAQAAISAATISNELLDIKCMASGF